MKVNKPALTVIGLLTLTVCLLLSSGCGETEKPENTEPGVSREPASSQATTDQETLLAQREETVSRREEDLDARMRKVDARIAELERQEARSSTPEPAVDTGPPYPRRFEVPVEPASAPEPVPQVVMLTLPAATPLEVELRDALSSETSLVGDPVRAVLTRDVLQDGLIALPAGADLVGSVVEAVPQKRIGGQARLAVEFDRVELPSGESVAVLARLDSAGKKQKKKDAVTIGGATAGGAILGHVLGGDDKTQSTLIGAVLGGAIGTAVAAKNQGDPVVLEPGMVSELELESPAHVAVTVPQGWTAVASVR
jgi:hypothetical protein